MFEKGKKYQCILSKSPGYKVGEIFECMQDEDGKLYLMGRDGFKDYTKDLLSGFKFYVKPKSNEKIKVMK